MNQPVALQPRQAREVRVVEDNSAVAYLFDTARFEHMQRIATAMASASLIPDHLKGKGADTAVAYQQTVGNCFLVVNQAVRWQMDPFAVAPETYSVGNKLAFQGKLVAAVVNARAGLRQSLKYTFEGVGEELTVTVHGTFASEDEERIITLRVKDAKTDNKMWSKDPEQKLIYSGAIKWARRHCPEIILGVLTDDDLERIAGDRAVELNPPARPTRDDFTGSKPEAEIIDAEVAEAGARAAKAEDATLTVAAEPYEVTSIDGEVLQYDEYDDFVEAAALEMKNANRAGLKQLEGWRESNKLVGIKPADLAEIDDGYKLYLAGHNAKATRAAAPDQERMV